MEPVSTSLRLAASWMAERRQYRTYPISCHWIPAGSAASRWRTGSAW